MHPDSFLNNIIQGHGGNEHCRHHVAYHEIICNRIQLFVREWFSMVPVLKGLRFSNFHARSAFLDCNLEG